MTTYVTFRCEACGVETDLMGKEEPPYSVRHQLANKFEWELVRRGK
jgi:hypothetical protein